MKLHGNAQLTIKQRLEIKRLHQAEKISVRALATRYGVTPKTIQIWIHRESPADRSTAPKTIHSVVTPAYQQAVLGHRQENQNQGPIRIAHELKSSFPEANRGSILRIPQKAKLTRRLEKKSPSPDSGRAIPGSNGLATTARD